MELHKYIFGACGALVLSACVSTSADESDRAAIEGVIQGYEAALNTSDVDAVMTLYAEDGVLMAPRGSSKVGADVVRAAYAGTFEAIKLDIEFDIQEIKQVAPEWAFARSNSAGSLTVNATGDTRPEENQELFVLQKVNGVWKIARYSFSNTSPPPQ